MMKAKVITLGCKVNQYESEAMLSSLLLTTAVIFVPGVNAFFHFADAAGNSIIDVKEYFIALALALSVIPIVELQKAIVSAVRKRKKK